MKKCVLGIDLGTSSVKILKKYRDGHTEKLKNTYADKLPLGWWNGIRKLLEEIAWDEVEAIGLTSQVGTYVINDEEVISWSSEAGAKELAYIKQTYEQKQFLEEISMYHPDIISYPLPRLKYIKEHFDEIQKVCQPKEYILGKLTGQWVTDMYSWRGLANLEREEYSEYFLKEIGFEKEKLPPIKSYKKIAGYTKEIKFSANVLPSGIPVYLGLNDYYAGLLGMGVLNEGQLFDLTGTSEHLGVLQEKMTQDSELVSGPYLKDAVHYGVTASSGISIRYGLSFSQPDSFDLEKICKEKPPIFLPYLKGERAPVWNPNARGVFFGVEDGCNEENLTYSIMEGVVFSLYHIYETMGKPDIKYVTVSGGAADIKCLNQLKAEVFRVPVESVKEKEVSALGACIVAALGVGWYETMEQAVKECVRIEQIQYPEGRYHQWFEKRFEIYKELYLSVKPLYEKWRKI